MHYIISFSVHIWQVVRLKHLRNIRMGQCTSYIMKWFLELLLLKLYTLKFICILYVLRKLHYSDVCGLKSVYRIMYCQVNTEIRLKMKFENSETPEHTKHFFFGCVKIIFLRNDGPFVYFITNAFNRHQIFDLIATHTR